MRLDWKLHYKSAIFLCLPFYTNVPCGNQTEYYCRPHHPTRCSQQRDHPLAARCVPRSQNPNPIDHGWDRVVGKTVSDTQEEDFRIGFIGKVTFMGSNMNLLCQVSLLLLLHNDLLLQVEKYCSCL